MPIKSIFTRISKPRETYTDGYGTVREVSEPKWVTGLRKGYNWMTIALNGPSKEGYEERGMKSPRTGAECWIELVQLKVAN